MTLSHHRKPYPAHSPSPAFQAFRCGSQASQRRGSNIINMLGQMSLPAFIQQVRLASQAITDNAVSVQQPYFYLTRRSAFTATGCIGAAGLNGSGSVLRGRFSRAKSKPPTRLRGSGVWCRSLTMTYSHMGKPHTTIGDASFHF